MNPDRLPLAALLVAVTAAALGCADHSTTGPTASPAVGAIARIAAPVLQASRKGGGGGGNGGVDSCSTVLVGMIRQTVGPAGGVVALGPARLTIPPTVGPAGGVVALGPARLTIPPGALSAPVTIQAQIPAGYSGNYIQFKPDKIVFQQPASLTISHSNCILANATQLKVPQVPYV